jgi:hypothetical protein
MSTLLSIKRIIDVQTIISATPPSRRDFRNNCFVFKGVMIGGARVNSYSSAADVATAYGSNSEPYKAALTFFSGGFNGIKPSTFWVANFDQAVGAEVWATVLNTLLSDPRYYLLNLDNTFSKAENLVFLAAVEASSAISYMGAVLDMEDIAASTTVTSDTTSIAASSFALKYTSSFVHYDNLASSAEYKQVADCSYFAQVNYTQARPLGSLAFKQFSGITPTDLSLGGVAIANTCAGNLDAKNCNYYTSFGEVGRSIAYKGVVPKGTQIKTEIGADWLTYNMTYAIYDLLVTLPNLAFTTADFSLLYSAIDTVCQQAVSFGLLAAGTDKTAGVDYPNGYIISIPDPASISTADKAAGLLAGITVTGLLGGVVLKIEVTNILKY